MDKDEQSQGGRGSSRAYGVHPDGHGLNVHAHQNHSCLLHPEELFPSSVWSPSYLKSVMYKIHFLAWLWRKDRILLSHSFALEIVPEMLLRPLFSCQFVISHQWAPTRCWSLAKANLPSQPCVPECLRWSRQPSEHFIFIIGFPLPNSLGYNRAHCHAYWYEDRLTSWDVQAETT